MWVQRTLIYTRHRTYRYIPISVDEKYASNK